MTKTKSGSFAVIGATALLLPLAAHAQSFTTLHSFSGGIDGANPYSVGLFNVGGTLYGTTQGGGTSNAGTVFKINPSAGAEAVLYSFAGGSDGQSPSAGLLNFGGILYGTTSGYPHATGTVFKFDPASGTETVLHNFSGNDGSQPWAALIKVGKEFYGTTAFGGASGSGTVFKVNPTTGAEKVLHSFANGSDGANPNGALLDAGGTLYGTTAFGGTSNDGTVFTINPKTGAETVLYSFVGGFDGCEPFASLINVGGTIFGTASACGTFSSGAVFSINPTTGAEKVVYSFAGGGDGANPQSALLDIKGMLYGTTASGGTSGFDGTVFEFNPATGGETVLHSFDGSDGESIHGAVVKVGKLLYGTAYFGGNSNLGTVFSLRP